MTPSLDAFAAVLVSWLLTYAIHSTILLAIAALAAWRFADQHAWLDLIWKTALVAPLLTATLQIDPIAVPLGGRWTVPGVAPVSGRSPVATASKALPSAAPVAARATPAPVVAGSARNEPVAPAADAGVTWWSSMAAWWPLLAALAWLSIAAAAVLRYAVRLRRVYAALGSGAPVTAAALVDALESLRRTANQRESIRLTTSDRCPVPLALGGRRIVLPERFIQELEPEQQRAALAHEVAHVARRDPEWRIAVEIVERILFFQPLNRLARVRLCDSAEFLCDEWAVQQMQSPLALARCLSVVASWWSPAGELPAGVSAMARSDSAMVRRVTRILDEPVNRSRRPRLLWLAIPVTLVAVAAPRVAATQLPVAATVLSGAIAGKAEEQRESRREWTAADIAAARAQLRVHRAARPGATLEERWRDALADAGKQRLSDFWIVYTFSTPTHADDQVMHDTGDGSFVTSNGRISLQGPPLTDLINPTAVSLESGNLVVLLHYRGTGANAIDRAGYRSAQLGFDFGRTPVFFLGDAAEAQSFERVQSLFGQTRTEKIQLFLIELASVHSNTNVVAPFLARLVEQSWPPAIRQEAAEGFEHHHDPRSVEILLRVARTDLDSGVRAEAAEAIGEVQTPQSIPALNDLVSRSTDPEVRREAAEAFASQPAAQALPALERVITTSQHDDVLGEAVEALGELDGPGALPLLVQTANAHANPVARQEAVETLGDLDQPGVVEALTRLAWEHQDVTIQAEAVETLGDRRDDAAALSALERIAREHTREEVQAEAIEAIGHRSSLHPLILQLAASGQSARVRREALEVIGEAVLKTGDPKLLDRAQQVMVRAIFDDPDHSVQDEALDALDQLPDARALAALRDVIARHPDARIRREADEHVRERRQ